MEWYKQSLLKRVANKLCVSVVLLATIYGSVGHVNAIPRVVCTIGVACTAGGGTTTIGGAIYPALGAAAHFAVLGATTVTNTGSTMLTSDLGVSPGSSCSGFPAPCTIGSGTLGGAMHVADATAAQAQANATNGYTFAAAQACTTTFAPDTDIGGMTLNAGVYCLPNSSAVTGVLTLDAEGSLAAAFIFKIGGSLTTASGAKVVLINSAQPSKVFWQVGNSATLGATTSFVGSIMALASITVMTAATSSCGLYALNGSVTLDSNIIQTCLLPSCASSSG